MPDWSLHPASRRAVLASGAMVATSTAGCSALSSDAPTLDVILYNQTGTAYRVEMCLLATDGDRSRREARVYDTSIDLDPDGNARLTDVAVSRQHVVQYEVYENNNSRTDKGHSHSYLVDDGEEWMAFDLQQPGVTWSQNNC